MRKKLAIGTAIGIAAIAAIGYAQFPSTPPTPPMPAAEAAQRTLGSFTLTAIDGAPLPLAAYKGKVVMLVNTASFCGFKKQFAGLEKLNEDYGPRGFTVVGVPSGSFKDQEYGANKEIADHCQMIGIHFPVAEKAAVVGAQALPVYKWAAAKVGPDNTPRWNFHKYLIARDGRTVTPFGTMTDPSDPKLRGAIEAALKVAAPHA